MQIDKDKVRLYLTPSPATGNMRVTLISELPLHDPISGMQFTIFHEARTIIRTTEDELSYRVEIMRSIAQLASRMVESMERCIEHHKL